MNYNKGLTQMANAMFNLGNTWSIKEGAKRLDIQVFFRGMSYAQDGILAQAKLQEAGFLLHQCVMLQGNEFKPGCRAIEGEVELGIVTYFLPHQQKDFIKKVYDTLFDCNINSQINPKHWLNDYDQYCKIQVRHRVNGGKWSEWQDEAKREAA